MENNENNVHFFKSFFGAIEVYDDGSLSYIQKC